MQDSHWRKNASGLAVSGDNQPRGGLTWSSSHKLYHCAIGPSQHEEGEQYPPIVSLRVSAGVAVQWNEQMTQLLGQPTQTEPQATQQNEGGSPQYEAQQVPPR